MKPWFQTLAVSVAVFLLPDSGVGAPVPKGGGQLIESENLRLEIRSPWGTTGDQRVNLTKESLIVGVYLVNRSKDHRVLPELIAQGNRIDRSHGVTYFFWFPDGTTVEVVPSLPGLVPIGVSEGGGKKPLLLPGEGFSSGEFDFNNSFSGTGVQDLVKKHKGQFCLTAVVAELRLQSNTLSYNGCKLPPVKYVPWKLSRNTPEKMRIIREERGKRLEAEKHGGSLTPGKPGTYENLYTPIISGFLDWPRDGSSDVPKPDKAKAP
jgi:hypothetical protein